MVEYPPGLFGIFTLDLLIITSVSRKNFSIILFAVSIAIIVINGIIVIIIIAIIISVIVSQLASQMRLIAIIISVIVSQLTSQMCPVICFVLFRFVSTDLLSVVLFSVSVIVVTLFISDPFLDPVCSDLRRIPVTYTVCSSRSRPCYVCLCYVRTIQTLLCMFMCTTSRPIKGNVASFVSPLGKRFTFRFSA